MFAHERFRLDLKHSQCIDPAPYADVQHFFIRLLENDDNDRTLDRLVIGALILCQGTNYFISLSYWVNVIWMNLYIIIFNISHYLISLREIEGSFILGKQIDGSWLRGWELFKPHGER